MQQEITTNAHAYHTIVERLRAAIKRKYNFFTKDVLLLHDTAQPYYVNTSLQLIQCFQWEIFEYLAYNHDLAACNYKLYPAVKDHLYIHTFQNDEYVKTVVMWWFQLQDTHTSTNGELKS
jgi:hypothetical protein